MKQKSQHSIAIDLMGGTTKVATLCEIGKSSVSDWRITGIPKARLQFLRLKFPKIKELKASK